MADLEKRREKLESKLKRKEDSHIKILAGHLNESAYQLSCKEMDEIYGELSEVCKELGDLFL